MYPHVNSPRTLNLRTRIILRSPPFPFLALPTELRYEVYKALAAALLLAPSRRRVRSTSLRTPLQAGHGSTRRMSADTFELQKACFKLLVLCRQVRDEAFPFVFARIVLPIRDPVDFGNNFLRQLEPDKLRQLKHFKFVAGSRYLFFAPMPNHLQNHLQLKQLVEVFKTYRGLSNLDTFTIECTLNTVRLINQSLLFTVAKLVTSSTLRYEPYHDHDRCPCPSIHCSRFAQYGDAHIFAVESTIFHLAKVRFKGFLLTKQVRDVDGSNFVGTAMNRIFTFTFENPSRPSARAAIQNLEDQRPRLSFGQSKRENEEA
jgi:hypothetical protein